MPADHERPSGRLPLVFASLGHAYMHFFGAFFFVAVLSLEQAWARPYHELIDLWTLGALLIGLTAVPAGWLADRWSAPGMMAVMFLGMGGAAIASGLASGPAELAPGLAAIGLFAGIYHPVGIAWVVRTAESQGRALGINGIFGSLGVAAAGIVTGVLTDLAGWRAAFVLPGAVSILTGLVLIACLKRGLLQDRKAERRAPSPPRTGDRVRAFALLLITMASVGLLFQATQTALPKLLDLRLAGRLGRGETGLGALVAGIYLAAGLMQLLGGHLADRLPLKRLYVGGLLVAAPIQLLMARVGGWPLVAVATLAGFANAAVLPAENLLLARFSPARHRSLAYGLKFVVSFGTAPLAVKLVAEVEAATGGLGLLFRLLAAVAAVGATVAWFLPRPGPAPTAGTVATLPDPA